MEAAENTKYRLAEGLKKVMEKYPVDKITVKQIVDESRVTRPTFIGILRINTISSTGILIRWQADPLNRWASG